MRSPRPLWALEEMGLDYELINMQFPPRDLSRLSELNPLGTVPTFTDGDLVMTESSGICQYLEDMYGPTSIGVAKDHPAYGEYLNWLYRSDATLMFPQTLCCATHVWSQKSVAFSSRRGYSIWPVTFALGGDGAGGQRVLCADKFTVAILPWLRPVPRRFSGAGCSLQTQL